MLFLFCQILELLTGTSPLDSVWLLVSDKPPLLVHHQAGQVFLLDNIISLKSICLGSEESQSPDKGVLVVFLHVHLLDPSVGTDQWLQIVQCN